MTITAILAVLAVATGGPAAGFTVDRSVVALPAWHRVGVDAWATFSRRADLGNGLVFYPIAGVSTWLLSIATAVSYAIEGGASTAAGAVYVAAGLAFAPALATSQAAPSMLRIRDSHDKDDLTSALARFTRWNHIRAVAQSAAFAANLWALVALLN
jgi:hypothetical protein